MTGAQVGPSHVLSQTAASVWPKQDLERYRRELEEARREAKQHAATAAKHLAEAKRAMADAAQLRAQLLELQQQVCGGCSSSEHSCSRGVVCYPVASVYVCVVASRGSATRWTGSAVPWSAS